MTDTMTITELHNYVETKFTGGYKCKAVLMAWDVATETATYLLSFHAMGRHVAKLDTTIYAQATEGAARGAATFTHKPTTKQDALYYVEVVTTDD